MFVDGLCKAMENNILKKTLHSLGFLHQNTIKQSNNNQINVEVEEYYHEKTGLNFVLIPPGSFFMGSDADHADNDEQPVHKVIISKPFLLSRTTCTQKAWFKGVEGINLSQDIRELANKAKFPSFGEGSNQPIYYVTWQDCLKWCQANSLELPTEAQWEYACRAKTNTEFNFGDISLENWKLLDHHMWYSENSRGKVPEVATFSCNSWGLYDLHGGVREWCRDTYDSKFYSRSNSIDPCNKELGENKVHRGGAWDVPPICCRSSARYRDAANYCLANIGFRPSLTLNF